MILHGTPVKSSVTISVVAPIITSPLARDKAQYIVGDEVIFTSAASNFRSWKIVWLKNGVEADALTTIQHGTTISAKGTVNSTDYNGAVLYVYPQINGGGTPVKSSVTISVVAPIITSFKTDKTLYAIGDWVYFTGAASNFRSWKIVWLKNGVEADAVTSIQHGSSISTSATVNSVQYNGAILYVYPQINGGARLLRGNTILLFGNYEKGTVNE